MKGPAAAGVLNYQEAAQRMAGGRFSPVYLFYGEELYLREELQRYLARSFLGESSSYGLERVEGADVPLIQILARLGGGNLFSEKKLIVVNNAPYLKPASPGDNNKVSNHGEKERTPSKKRGNEEDPSLELQGFLEQEAGVHSPENIILFQSIAVDRRKKFFKLLKDKGVVVDCSPLKGGELAAWIRRKVDKLGKKIENSAVERLLLGGSSSLWHLSTEIDKYVTYLDESGEVITAEIVDLLYAGDAQGNVFKLADALSEGNLARALELLQHLLQRREKPVPIFFMLVRHYRLLLTAYALDEEGVAPAQYASYLQVPPFAADKLRQQAAGYSLKALQNIMLALQKIDLQIKTGRLEPHHALEIALGQIHHIYSSM